MASSLCLTLVVGLCLIAVISGELRYSYGFADSATRLKEMKYTTGSSVKMPSPSANYMMRLYPTPAPPTGGVAYYQTPVTSPHNGFISKFTYLPSVCDSINKGGPGGFSFFLTTDNITANWGPTTQPDEFALNSLNNVVMAGYSQTFNEFLLCNWNAAPRNSALRDICPKLANTSPKYSCATFNQSESLSASYEFKVIYDRKTLSIYVEDELQFSQPLKLAAARYTIGFSANTGSSYTLFKQQITNWNFTSFDTPVSDSFEYDSQGNNDDRIKFQYIGQAALTSDSIQLLSSREFTSGAFFTTSTVAAHRGFRTRLTWVASECSGGPGDGFAFYLTPKYPAPNDILYSYGNTLGVTNLDKAFTVGYSAFLSEIRACNWIEDQSACPSATCLGKPYTGAFSCNATYYVDIHFRDQELKVYFNQRLVYHNLTNIALTPGLYYTGVTAANGAKFMRQDITSWSFELWESYSQGFAGSNTTLLETFGSASASSTELLLTTNPRGGLVVTRAQSPVSRGFRSTFTFSPDYVGSAGGISFFLSKTYPSAKQLNDSYGNGYGIRTLPNTFALVIVLTGTQSVKQVTHYTCQWDTPLASANFPGGCAHGFSVGTIGRRVKQRYSIQYDFNTLEVYINESLVHSSALSLDWESYYVGFTGYGSSYYPAISLWQFNSSAGDTIDKKLFNTFASSDFLPYSDATVVPTQLQLTAPNYTSVGAAIHSNKLFSYLGFQSKFNYIATSCTNKNASLRGLPEGFTFFLSNDIPSANMVASSIGTGLGLLSIPNVALTVGYDNVQNVFLVCNWDTASASFASTSTCKSYPNAGAAYSCNATYVYSLFYDNKMLQVFVNNTLVVAHYVKLAGVEYYAGFTAANADDQFAQQSITNWVYTYYQPSFGEQFNFVFSEGVDLVTLGSANIVNSKLVLTNTSDQAGAAFYPHLLHPDAGFNSSLIFLPINCDPVYNGADGFTLFFTKQYPAEEHIVASAGGLMGIQQQPDVSMFAYSATFNEFFIANWTTPTTDLLRWFGQNIPNPQPKLACNGIYYFDILYERNTLSVFLNFNLVLTAPMYFDPVGYYVGLSGGTGEGYFSQEFGTWRFNSYDSN